MSDRPEPVGNTVSWPGTFDDLRGFVAGCAGDRVQVYVEAANETDQCPLLTADGIVKPVTIEDKRRRWGSGQPREELARDLAQWAERGVEFELIDSGGAVTASFAVSDAAAMNILVGRFGEVSERQGREVVVSLDFLRFEVDASKQQRERRDDGDGRELCGECRVRIERWVRRPLEQALKA